jgi:hypothetical protein
VSDPKFQVGDRVRARGSSGTVEELDPRSAMIKVRIDPTLFRWVFEDDVIAATPTTERHHDGQANTSGLEREPEDDAHQFVRDFWAKHRTIPEPSGVNSAREAMRKILADYREGRVVEMPITIPPRPSLLTVLEGVLRWQQVDPAHRRAHASLSGRTITVHVTTLPDLGTRKVKFCSAYTAEEVVHVLDDVALVATAHPDVEFTMSRNDLRITEDTGETD